MAHCACLWLCLSDAYQTNAGGGLFPTWTPCMYTVACLQSCIRLHLLSGLWTHVVAFFQGYFSMGLSPLAPEWTPLEGLQSCFITCSVSITSSARHIQTQGDCNPLLGTLSGLRSSSASGSPFFRENPTHVIPWEPLASGLYDRLRKIRRVYQHMTHKNGYPKQLCSLWRVFDLAKQELRQRRSQPFKSSSLAIPPSLTVACPHSQLHDLDRKTYQIFFQSEFQKYQWFKMFLEPWRLLSTYFLYDNPCKVMHSGFSKIWPAKVCFGECLR